MDIGAQLRSAKGLTFTILSLTLFVGNIIFSAVGVRGSDQYWYVGDLLMSKITGMPVTNAIYPSATELAARTTVDALPPPIHNLPVTYLAGLAHQLGAGEYLAWVYVNFSLALVIASTVYFVARSHGYSYAFIAPALFLSFPLTLWLSINALADMSLALGSCLLMIGATVVARTAKDQGGRVSVGLLFIAAGSVLMYYTRDNYVLLFPALVLFTIWVCRSYRMRWVWAVLILGTTAVLAAVKHTVLPQYPIAGLLSQLMIGTPSNNGEMASYYHLAQVPFSLSEVLLKSIDGLRNALLPSGPSELITELPVVAVVIVALIAFRKDAGTRILKFWMFVVMAIYLITAAAFQSQNRYIFALVPFVAVLGAGYMERIIRPVARGILPNILPNVLRLAPICFLVVCILGSLLMARTYRMEATAEVAQTRRLVAGLAGEPSGSVLAVAETSKLLPLTYAAVPRPVLAVDPQINSTADAARLIRTWKVRVLVGAGGADLQYFSRAVGLAFGGAVKLVPQSPYDTPGGPIKTWLIEPPSTSVSTAVEN